MVDKRPLKVFLCHAHADRDPVRGLYTRLTQDGVDAWLDKAKLLPGQDWELEIRKAVREADVVVVCLSKQFNQAGFRQKEVRLALDTAMEKPEGEIFIIPARLEECDTLESLRKWHWVDLFEDDGYEMLIRALRARADRIGATLQIKKSWPPKANTQSVVIKKPSTPIERPVETKQEKPKSKKVIQIPKTYNKIIISIVGFVVFVLMMIFGLPLLNGKQNQAPTATSFPTSKSETPVSPNQTLVPVFYTPTVYIGPLPTEINDTKDVQMVLVPAGTFTMGGSAEMAVDECQKLYIGGAESCGRYGYTDEEPAHTVYLDAYYMDKYEVSNAAYRQCVNTGICDRPKSIHYTDMEISNYYDNSQYDDYPVVFVTWNMTKTYCEWRGARLPTEAEWEKAARGPDGRIYPWGNIFDGTKANFCDANCDQSWSNKNFDDGYADIAPVVSFPKGASIYGVFNLAGNVWEWVADWYDSAYYNQSPTSDPQGPPSGTAHVVRGGAAYLHGDFLRSTERYKDDPTNSDNYLGFRCASSAP